MVYEITKGHCSAGAGSPASAGELLPLWGERCCVMRVCVINSAGRGDDFESVEGNVFEARSENEQQPEKLALNPLGKTNVSSSTGSLA